MKSIAKTQIGADADGGFFLHFFYADGTEAYLTVDRPCHVLIPGRNDQPSQYGDDVTPYEAFKMLTGVDVDEVLPHDGHPQRDENSFPDPIV